MWGLYMVISNSLIKMGIPLFYCHATAVNARRMWIGGSVVRAAVRV